MIVVLLLGWLCPALGLPEIWPPDGRLRPNNYVPPPVCSYVQVSNATNKQSTNKQTTNNKQQTTDNRQQTTNNKQQTN